MAEGARFNAADPTLDLGVDGEEALVVRLVGERDDVAAESCSLAGVWKGRSQSSSVLRSAMRSATTLSPY